MSKRDVYKCPKCGRQCESDFCYLCTCEAVKDLTVDDLAPTPIEQLRVQVVNDALKSFKAAVIQQFTNLENGDNLMAFSLTKKMEGSGSSGSGKKFAKLLKCSGVTKGKIEVVATALREAPATWNAVAIMDFKPVDGFGSVALNQTNGQIVADAVGDNVKGKRFTFTVVDVEYQDELVPGLRITHINGKKV